MGAQNSCGSGEEPLVEFCKNFNEHVFGDDSSVHVRLISWSAEELRPLIHTVVSKIRCGTEILVFFLSFSFGNF